MRASISSSLHNSRLAPCSAPGYVQRRFIKRPSVNTSQLTEGRRTGALAMKVGMMPLYDKWAVRHPVTVLQLDNCQVIQVKTEEKEGLNALVLGVGESKPKNVAHPQKVLFSKLNIKPKRKLSEFRVSSDCLIPVGTKISALHFIPGQLVDVCGTSKGKGFAGAMKRWNFGGGSASHGNSLSHRILGSTGMRQDPGKVFKGKKMAGRLGGERVTVQNLKVLKIDPSLDLLYVSGAVPGNNGGFVRVTDAVKGPFYPEKPPIPTYLVQQTDPQFPKESLFAPVSEKDALLQVEPEDPY